HFRQGAPALAVGVGGFPGVLQRSVDRGVGHPLGVCSASGDPARARWLDGKIPIRSEVLEEELFHI
ncbi:MAG: hypothetical protein WA813_10460, partial [Beijerinckiaceae bacterium]